MNNNKYDDEDILAIRQSLYDHEEDLAKIENKIENDIQNGYISIDGYKIPFSEKTVKDKIKITLPTEFEQMDDLYIEIKYPAYKNKEKIIFTNQDTTINFMFDFGERFIQPNELEEVSEQLLGFIKKAQPSLKLLEKSMEKLPHMEIAFFEIVTPALDKDIYNFMYFFIIDEKLVMASFNCFDDEKNQWQPIIRQVIKSITIIEGGVSL